MLDQIFNLFLSFSHERVIVALIVLGYIWLDRKLFFHGICLLLINMLWNLALKATFKIPLSSTLGKVGFAFPSGHMQNAIVFYGWLLKGINRSIIKIAIFCLLLGIYLGLLYFGYHNLLDLGGAIFFGIALLVGYSYLLEQRAAKWLASNLFIASSILIIYTAIVYEIKPYAWLAYYALIGLLCGQWQFAKSIAIGKKLQQKFIATMLYLIILWTINKLFSILNLPSYLSELKWLFLGYCLPLIVFIAAKLDKN